MSDLFLTSAGLELGETGDLKVSDGIEVSVNNVQGRLLKLTTGREKILKLITDDVKGALVLTNEKITDATIEYCGELIIIRFDSYNYTIEKSLEMAIITIEDFHVEQK